MVTKRFVLSTFAFVAFLCVNGCQRDGENAKPIGPEAESQEPRVHGPDEADPERQPLVADNVEQDQQIQSLDQTPMATTEADPTLAEELEQDSAPGQNSVQSPSPTEELAPPSPGVEDSEDASDEDALTRAGAPGEASTEPAPLDETTGEEATPLVDDPETLAKLHPRYPVWFDKETNSVVLVGSVCQRRVPLEMFACLRHSKEHESVVVVDTKAYVVHAGLLVAGVEPGNPVQFYPEYVPARGPEIEVTVLWKDAQENPQRARAQEWIRDIKTGKSMQHSWVFAGSFFSEDEQTGERYYHGDTDGDLICVSNFPSAVLDLPIKSSDSNSALLFEAFTERIPPLGTPVTLVLTPKVSQSDEAASSADKDGPPEKNPVIESSGPDTPAADKTENDERP